MIPVTIRALMGICCGYPLQESRFSPSAIPSGAIYSAVFHSRKTTRIVGHVSRYDVRINL